MQIHLSLEYISSSANEIMFYLGKNLQNIICVLAKYIFLCSKSPIALTRMWHKCRAMNMKQVTEWEGRK